MVFKKILLYFRCLSQSLRRYTGLNHLAQAAKAVLQNPSQINQVRNLGFFEEKSILAIFAFFRPDAD